MDWAQYTADCQAIERVIMRTPGAQGCLVRVDVLGGEEGWGCSVTPDGSVFVDGTAEVYAYGPDPLSALRAALAAMPQIASR